MTTSRSAGGDASALGMDRALARLRKRGRAMTGEGDHIARYQRPPPKGQFKPGQSGNLRGRPKGSKNIRTYVNEHLSKKIQIIEGGKTRKAPRAEAIAIQLVNQAAKGEPKGLAAIISLTREFDAAVGELRPNVLARPKTRSSLRASSLASGQETPLRCRIRYPGLRTRMRPRSTTQPQTLIRMQFHDDLHA